MTRVRTIRRLVTACLMVTALWALPAPASAVQLNIEADTFVNSASVNQNNGTSTSLKVSPSLSTFMKFDLTTLPGGTVAGGHPEGHALVLREHRDHARSREHQDPGCQRLGGDEPHLRQPTRPWQPHGS